jgi:hypothetical protein
MDPVIVRGFDGEAEGCDGTDQGGWVIAFFGKSFPLNYLFLLE